MSFLYACSCKRTGRTPISQEVPLLDFLRANRLLSYRSPFPSIDIPPWMCYLLHLT